MALLYIFSFIHNNSISLKYNKDHFYRVQKSRRRPEEQTKAEASKGQQFEYVIINIPQVYSLGFLTCKNVLNTNRTLICLQRQKLLFLLSIAENAGLKAFKTHGMSLHT